MLLGKFWLLRFEVWFGWVGGDHNSNSNITTKDY